MRTNLPAYSGTCDKRRLRQNAHVKDCWTIWGREQARSCTGEMPACSISAFWGLVIPCELRPMPVTIWFDSWFAACLSRIVALPIFGHLLIARRLAYCLRMLHYLLEWPYSMWVVMIFWGGHRKSGLLEPVDMFLRRDAGQEAAASWIEWSFYGNVRRCSFFEWIPLSRLFFLISVPEAASWPIYLRKRRWYISCKTQPDV